MPSGTRHQKYREINAQTGKPHGFQTSTGKIEIFATSFAKAGYPPLPVWQAAESILRGQANEEDYPLTLTFSRLTQFVNDAHRNVPRLRRQVRDPFLEIHPDTAGALDIENDDWVIVETCKGAVTLKAKLRAVDPRVDVTQYGWWQACQELGASSYDPFGVDGANTNLLINAELSNPIRGQLRTDPSAVGFGSGANRWPTRVTCEPALLLRRSQDGFPKLLPLFTMS